MHCQSFQDKNGMVEIVVSNQKDNNQASGYDIPKRVCLVIDLSGSMDSEVYFQNDSGKQESNGFSRLDLAKHSANTIIESLNKTDQLSLVSFSATSSVDLTFASMTPENKEKAINIVNNYHTIGMTNLWSGLKEGLNLFKTPSQNQQVHNDAIFLLTDGISNSNPMIGIEKSLEKYIVDSTNLPSLYSFGFTYDCDATLLDNLSMKCGGYYGFIPDGTFIGTVFTNSLANLNTVREKNLVLEITTEHKINLDEIPYKSTKTSYGYCFSLGDLQEDQSKHLVFKTDVIDNEFPLMTSVKYYDLASTETKEVVNSDTQRIIKRDETIVHQYRQKLVILLNQLCQTYHTIDDRKSYIKNFLEELDNLDSEMKSNLLIKGFREDLVGEISNACSRSDWYNKWGLRWMKSLRSAHLYQIQNNFKDPGVQNYCNKIFQNEVDRITSVFTEVVKPPKPTFKGGIREAITSQTMSTRYMNSNNTCWIKDTMVKLSNGSSKAIQNLKKGDLVKTNKGSNRVLCLVETKINGKMDICYLPGTKPTGITPWHPVNNNDNWIFPIDLVKTESVEVSSVYNLVLENFDQQLCVLTNDQHWGITLAHGNQSDPVLKHPYFGTYNVIRDLKDLEGWNLGHVIINQITRDPKSDLICKLA